MTSSTAKKYIRIRTAMLVLPIFIFFLCYILFAFLLPDFFLSKDALITDTGIIKAAYKTTYKTYDNYNGTYYPRCVDIQLVNKSYYIRLTDNLLEKYWPAIASPENINKKIEVKYQARLMDNNMLNNPEQISINNTLIFPYTAKRKFIGWFAVAVSGAILISSLLLYRVFNIYKLNLFDYDKEIGKESKWKLLKVWLAD